MNFHCNVGIPLLFERLLYYQSEINYTMTYIRLTTFIQNYLQNTSHLTSQGQLGAPPRYCSLVARSNSKPKVPCWLVEEGWFAKPSGVCMNLMKYVVVERSLTPLKMNMVHLNITIEKLPIEKEDWLSSTHHFYFWILNFPGGGQSLFCTHLEHSWPWLFAI